MKYRRNETCHKLMALEEDFLNRFKSLLAGYSYPFENLREEYANTRWNRIANVSVKGDKHINKIKTLCQIPKTFEEQGYYVLNSRNLIQYKLSMKL